MDIKSRFSDNLSRLLFLEINKENVKRIFNVEIEEDIYLPVKSTNIVDNVKAQDNMEKIPVSFFIEGMFYVLGADPNFKFNECYKKIISNLDNSTKFIKGKIAEEVKEKNYEDGYIFLKGLVTVEETREVYDKLIIMSDELRKSDKGYKEEELEILEKAKQSENYSLPYLYEALIRREEGDFEKALFCINNYISKGGEESVEITELKESLKSVVNYEKAKELLYDSPQEALKIFLSLIDTFGDDASLCYHIAVAYRILQNYEKAIYYLNEALNIDSNVIEVVNELGINYASLGDFDIAISYLRKAFEVTKSVEICTNLIMCYLNSGNVQMAKDHLEIAKRLDSQDEIVIQLEGIIKNL